MSDDPAIPDKSREDRSALPPEVLTVEEAAALLRMSPDQVRILARQGKIPAGKVGQAWRFSRRALLRLVGESTD